MRDKYFEDLLEGLDYTTSQRREHTAHNAFRAIKKAAGLTLMMADVIFIDKILGGWPPSPYDQVTLDNKTDQTVGDVNSLSDFFAR